MTFRTPFRSVSMRRIDLRCLIASRWGVRGSPVDRMFEAVPLPAMMLLFARCELGDKLYML